VLEVEILLNETHIAGESKIIALITDKMSSNIKTELNITIIEN